MKFALAAALGIALAAVAAPLKQDPLRDVRWTDPDTLVPMRPPPVDLTALRDLPNPIAPDRPPAGEVLMNLTLVGTIVAEDPAKRLAFLALADRQVQVLCGERVPGRAEWTLAEVGKRHAVLRSGARTVILWLDPAAR